MRAVKLPLSCVTYSSGTFSHVPAVASFISNPFSASSFPLPCSQATFVQASTPSVDISDSDGTIYRVHSSIIPWYTMMTFWYPKEKSVSFSFSGEYEVIP